LAETRRHQLESARAFVESAQKRTEAGYASDFEVIKSQADLIAASKALQQAQLRITIARATLNILAGRPASSPLKAHGNLDDLRLTGFRTDLVALAMARNPAIRAQMRQAEIAGLNLRLTRVGRRPDVTIGPSVEYLEDEQTYGISATLALPLWDQKKGALETATADQKKALAELEKTRAEIAGEVSKATASLQSAKEQLALYTPVFLDQLKALVTQAEQSYAQNATTLLIYLDTKRTYFDTLADYYESLSQVAQSRADLESAVGVPLELKD
jgi:cobalt-zinc-cadmium efflux system outer membrane protein